MKVKNYAYRMVESNPSKMTQVAKRKADPQTQLTPKALVYSL